MPKLFWLEKDPSIIGMPFYVMERVTGKVPVQWEPNDPEMFPTPEARHRIGIDFVDALAAIHAVDLSGEWVQHFGAVPSRRPTRGPRSTTGPQYFDNSAHRADPDHRLRGVVAAPQPGLLAARSR